MLFIETIKTICGKDYSPDQINIWCAAVKDTQRWINKLKTQYFVVAETNNKIIGYASLDNNTYLDLLYVHKDFQRLGVANILIDNIESEALTHHTTILKADVSITAKSFFEKKGYKILDTNTQKINNVEITNYKMAKALQG